VNFLQKYWLQSWNNNDNEMKISNHADPYNPDIESSFSYMFTRKTLFIFWLRKSTILVNSYLCRGLLFTTLSKKILCFAFKQMKHCCMNGGFNFMHITPFSNMIWLLFHYVFMSSPFPITPILACVFLYLVWCLCYFYSKIFRLFLFLIRGNC